MGPITQAYDVTAHTPFSDEQTIAGWLFAPEDAALRKPESLVVCLAGGTYSKAYFHFFPRGIAGYSMAEYFTARGHLVLALDHLGSGESSHPAQEHLLTRYIMAAAHHAAVRAALDRLGDGSAHPALPPIRGLTLTGVGHSMGGMLLVTQQGRHGTFDRIAPLGWANSPSAAIADTKDMMPPPDEPRYVMGIRADTHRLCYMEDVPEALIAADDAAATSVSRTLLSELQMPGIALAQAGQIDVPVFIGFGERDISLNPHLEPSTYPLSRDVTLYILKNSGHCHNLASSRRRLWEKVCNWIECG